MKKVVSFLFGWIIAFSVFSVSAIEISVDIKNQHRQCVTSLKALEMNGDARVDRVVFIEADKSGDRTIEVTIGKIDPPEFEAFIRPVLSGMLPKGPQIIPTKQTPLTAEEKEKNKRNAVNWILFPNLDDSKKLNIALTQSLNPSDLEEVAVAIKRRGPYLNSPERVDSLRITKVVKESALLEAQFELGSWDDFVAGRDIKIILNPTALEELGNFYSRMVGGLIDGFSLPPLLEDNAISPDVETIVTFEGQVTFEGNMKELVFKVPHQTGKTSLSLKLPEPGGF